MYQTPFHYASENRCDTHVHVFDPERFPYATNRTYTPPEARVDALRQMLGSLGNKRVVLVQPSVYGFDNRCLVDALQELGLEQARGVAVVDLDKTTPMQLRELHEAGVRGLRLNLRARASVEASAVHKLQQDLLQAARLLTHSTSPLGWHIQLHAPLQLLDAQRKAFATLGVPVVLDHYAGCWQDDPISLMQLKNLLDDMRRCPSIYVKLSAPYRLESAEPLAHMQRMAQALAQAAPKQIMWGTDWPHTGGAKRYAESTDIEPFRVVDNAYWLSELLACMPSDAVRERLMVHNAAALYGFTPSLTTP